MQELHDWGAHGKRGGQGVSVFWKASAVPTIAGREVFKSMVRNEGVEEQQKQCFTVRKKLGEKKLGTGPHDDLLYMIVHATHSAQPHKCQQGDAGNQITCYSRHPYQDPYRRL
jgi:hypothetical protein